VAQRVGLVAFAGELAGSLGITGWPEEQAHDYAVEVLNSWVSERPGKWGNGERAAALAAVRDWIARHGDMFDDRPGEDRAPNRVDKAGWVYSEFRGLRLDDAVSRGIGPLGPEEEEAEVTRIFQVIPAFFDEVICKDVGKAVALSVIRPHIIMKKEKDGKGLERERHDPKTYIKGARITTRVIHIRGSILNDFGEGATG
jgi:hypothetical protein